MTRIRISSPRFSLRSLRSAPPSYPAVNLIVDPCFSQCNVKIRLFHETPLFRFAKRDASNEIEPKSIALPTSEELVPDELGLNEKAKTKNWQDFLNSAWEDYKYTWEGFFDNFKEKDEIAFKPSILDGVDGERILKKRDEVHGNIKRNVESVREEGDALISTVKNVTGIETQQELKIWAMQQLKVANECVATFMEGYRKGRDGEVDKMLNQYFKDIDLEKENEVEEQRIVVKAGRKRRRKTKK
eukprot:CAMPEP_0194124028 /NCGR_PEP_ID=MMETSP0150-20130528/56959_1 /TAXON_ID=122233 /ORGANISM="Chaetoceros debilis, Strain MM31A-1" /LENGTH=242 /DNA_ID=CAMNT_0038817547 /DNA_START=220 /DNA_END=945 /DNA_ORIENTATION=-